MTTARDINAIKIPASIPGAALVQQGIEDLISGFDSVPALLLIAARTKFYSIGIDLPGIVCHEPDRKMYEKLASQYGAGAHSKYNALRRELVSFFRTYPTQRSA